MMMSEPRKPLFDPSTLRYDGRTADGVLPAERFATFTFTAGRRLIGDDRSYQYAVDTDARLAADVWRHFYGELHTVAGRARSFAVALHAGRLPMPYDGMARDLVDLVEQIKQLTAPPARGPKSGRV